MSKYKPYCVCPRCGSNLDWGERCDCMNRREGEHESGREAAKSAAQPVIITDAGNTREPVLMPGA